MFVTRDIFYCCKCIQISKISIKKSKAWKLPFSDFPVFHWRNEHLPLICPIFDHVYVNIWSKHMGIAFFRIYSAKWILAPNLTLYVNFLDEGTLYYYSKILILTQKFVKITFFRNSIINMNIYPLFDHLWQFWLK